MMKRFVILLVFAITISGDIILLQDGGEEHTVTVDGFGSNIRFVPETLTINEGDSVRFLWSGQLLPHNAIEVNEVFNSGEAMSNVDYTYNFTYNQSGVYEFYCEPHRNLGMLGEITVLDVKQDNISTGDELQTKTDDVVSEDISKINFYVLSVVGLVILVLLYYRTRIDNITKI
jgi:plastocyanin